MKRIIATSLFLFCLLITVSAQNVRFAWIVSPTAGSPGADSSLTNIVKDINLSDNLKFVIITGNLTAGDNIFELDSLKSILDKLTIPCYVVPGENDLRWSPDAGLKIHSLFNDGHFNFELDSTGYIGLNTSTLWRGGGGHFSPEEIKWLGSSLKNTSPNEDIFIFSAFPFNEKLDNWFKAANILNNYHSRVLFTTNEKPETITKTGGITTISGTPVIDKEKWGYNVIENYGDTLSLFSVRNGDTKIWGKITKDKSQFEKINTDQFLDFSGIVGKGIPKLKSTVLWKKELNSTTLSNLCTTDDKIILASFNGTITCFDTSGKKLWGYKSTEKIIGTPVSQGKIFITATLQGDLISIDINTGKVIQVIGIGEPLTSELVLTDIVYNGSPTTGVIVGTANGKLYCYDIYSFELIWENDSARGLVRSKPLVIRHRIFFGSRDGFLYSVDARTGSLYWKWTNGNNFFTSPSVCPPVSDGQYIYIAAPDKNVYKIDMLLGVTKWAKDYNAWESINISADNNYLIVKSISNKVYFVSTKNGRRYKEINLGFGFDLNAGQPLNWNGNFLIGSENGKVYLIDNEYKSKPLFFAGNASLNSIQHVKGNMFAVSNIDGEIVCFEIN